MGAGGETALGELSGTSSPLPCLFTRYRVGIRTKGTSKSNEMRELRGAPGDLQGCLGGGGGDGLLGEGVMGSPRTPPSTSTGLFLDLFCFLLFKIS